MIAACLLPAPAGASECITGISTSKVKVVDSVTPKKVFGVVVDIKTTVTPVVSDVTASNGGAMSVLGGLACGDNANAATPTATAVGTEAYAASKNTAAFGFAAKALALNSSAFGAGAEASGFHSSAFGAGAQASGFSSSAFGQAAQATATGATAIGQGANAGHANATAVGTGAATTRADQMMFGTAGNTYTAPGITSAASKAAQSGPVSLVTTDAQGNLATDGGLVTSQINQAFKRLDENTQQINQAFKRLDENAQGIAIALAMGGIYVPESKLFSFTAGYGTFDGANAFATQLAYRLDSKTILTGGVGVGLENNDATTKVGGRVGFQVSW